MNGKEVNGFRRLFNELAIDNPQPAWQGWQGKPKAEGSKLKAKKLVSH